jgi:hypothetical protein
VAYNGDTKRHRTVLALGVHAEKDLGKAWKLYMNYSFDRSLSNEEFDEYQVNTVSGGVEFRF